MGWGKFDLMYKYYRLNVLKEPCEFKMYLVTMEGHRQLTWKICGKTMWIDDLKRHKKKYENKAPQKFFDFSFEIEEYLSSESMKKLKSYEADIRKEMKWMNTM